MNKTIVALGVMSICVLFWANGANAGIKEGQWSMTTVIRMEGMDTQASEAMHEMENMSPEEKAMMQNMMGGMNINANGGGMGMTTTRTQCLTNDNPVPEANDEENCQKTHNINGNTVNFEVVCADSRSTGQVTYNNESMQGTIQSIQTATGQAITIDISGQYVGPCDQSTSNITAPALSERELAIKQRELDLKVKELELKQKELDLAGTNAGKNKSSGKATLQDVNNAVNTGNTVKNTFNGLRSLLGR